MSEITMHIDPEKFAYHFVDSLNLESQLENSDVEHAAKVRLASYLSAYFLIEKFNQQEAKSFNTSSSNHKTFSGDMSFKEILQSVFEINEEAADNLRN